MARVGRPLAEGGTPEQIKRREAERARHRAWYHQTHHVKVAAGAELREVAASEKAVAARPRKKTPSMSKPLPESRPSAQISRWPVDSIILPPTLAQLMGRR